MLYFFATVFYLNYKFFYDVVEYYVKLIRQLIIRGVYDNKNNKRW